MRKCHNCQRSTFDSAKFCHHCGAKMDGNARTEIPSDLPKEKIEQPAENKKPQIELEIVETPIQEEGNWKKITEETEEEKPNQEAKEPLDFLPKEEVLQESPLEEQLSLNDLFQEVPEKILVEESPLTEEIPTEPKEENPSINDLFEENPNQDIEEEIFKQFAIAFEKQLKTEQNPAYYNAYVDRFEGSDFKISFEYRIKQLAEQVQKIRSDQSNLLQNEEQLLEQAFTELIDYFVIQYCSDLNAVHLSEAILKYQNVPIEKIDLSALVLDYLDFQQEDERVHFDFIKMPMQRLKNAGQSFLFPEKGEKIFFICDQTILGSGKEGFAMTEKAIYWKMQFESAERVYYHNLQNIEKQKEWITINEMFFNANPSLNVKMMKLLKKLKTLF